VAGLSSETLRPNDVDRRRRASSGVVGVDIDVDVSLSYVGYEEGVAVTEDACSGG
jgi:hypothetical protein